MSGHRVSIDLAPDWTLGRRMQYVFLSYAARHGDVMITRYEALVDAHAFKAAIEDIIGVINVRLKRVAGKKWKGPISSVSGLKGYCGFLGKQSVSPSLFFAGRNDKKLLQSHFLASLGASPVCQKGPYWLEAALIYGLTMLTSNSATARSTSGLDLPWMAKATVFSYVRDSLGKTRASVSVDGLGSLLLGGAASLLGSYGGSQIFLAPEGVDEGVSNFIAWLEKGDSSPVIEALRVSGETGASLEIVLSLMLAEHVSRVGVLQPGGLLPPMRLLLVNVGGNRPLTLEGVPVSMAVAKHSWSIDVSSELLRLYRAAAAQKRRSPLVYQAASDVFTFCSYSVYHVAGSDDRALHLAECAREVHRLGHISEAGPIAGAARRVLKSIASAVE